MAEDALALARWRLVLGRFAEEPLAGAMGAGEGYEAMDRLLDHLYGREYTKRGVRGPSGGPAAGSGASVLSVPEWIRGLRDLFPSDVCEVVTHHALERYGLTEIVSDPDTLRSLAPSYDLLKAVLTFKGLMRGEALDVARAIVRAVVEDLRRRLERDVRAALSGRPSRARRVRFGSSRDLDARRTVRANLARWDPERRAIVASELWFTSRARRYALPWEVVVCVDCSGSMADSVIHSAVMAAIFAGLPSLRVRLFAFDTAVVDLSAQADDPADVLMSVQLGGGTDIAGAVAYASTRIEQPSRCLFVLVTDFCEGGSPARLVAQIRKLRGDGVRVLGLAALDRDATPVYDRHLAGECAAAGAEVAAMTPSRLAEWVAGVIG